MLTDKQKKQEELYCLPYHWFMQPDTVSGRIYFGYLSICLDLLLNSVNKEQFADLKVLDAGCGDGRFLKELQKIGIKHLYGVDYSERALSFGRLLIPEANFFKADLTTKIPFEDEFFDAIFMIETLEHIIPEKINNLLINLRRVLKKDGIIVITVPSINAPLPPNSKHYQHFSIDLLRHYIEPHFKIDLFVGQDKIGFHIFKLFYRLLDNRYWEIKSLTRYYNLYIWPRFFNKCSLSYGGRRLIVRAVKI